MAVTSKAIARIAAKIEAGRNPTKPELRSLAASALRQAEYEPKFKDLKRAIHAIRKLLKQERYLETRLGLDAMESMLPHRLPKEGM